MTKFVTIISILFSIKIFAGSSIISLENSELFGDLGYKKGEVVVFNLGDFGEGGGGNRPIKTIGEEEDEDQSLVHYYPKEYRVNFQMASKDILAKISLHKVKNFMVFGHKKLNFFSIDDIHSFDLDFADVVDLNNISVVNISSFATNSGEVYFAEDIFSLDIDAIIEPSK